MNAKFSCLLAAVVLAACFVKAQAPPALPTLPTVTFPAESEFPGKGPIPKSEAFQRTWKIRRANFIASKMGQRHSVVFLGDSITQGWTTLNRDFPKMKTANRGISGDMTRGVLLRLKEDVLDLEPEAIVLLIGTNDLGNGGKPEDAADNVRDILQAIHASNSKTPIIVCKVMPSSAKQKRPADKIQALNTLVDKIVQAEPNCIRCDTWSIFANDQGDAKAEEFKDLLHPNAGGYAKWKAALDPILAQLKL